MHLISANLVISSRRYSPSPSPRRSLKGENGRSNYPQRQQEQHGSPVVSVAPAEVPVSLGQHFKLINTRISGGGRRATAQRLSFPSAEVCKRKDEEAMGDSSMSGDEEDNGWKALRYALISSQVLLVIVVSYLATQTLAVFGERAV